MGAGDRGASRSRSLIKTPWPWELAGVRVGVASALQVLRVSSPGPVFLSQEEPGQPAVPQDTRVALSLLQEMKVTVLRDRRVAASTGHAKPCLVSHLCEEVCPRLPRVTWQGHSSAYNL